MDATDYMLSGDYRYIAFESNFTKVRNFTFIFFMHYLALKEKKKFIVHVTLQMIPNRKQKKQYKTFVFALQQKWRHSYTASYSIYDRENS